MMIHIIQIMNYSDILDSYVLPLVWVNLTLNGSLLKYLTVVISSYKSSSVVRYPLISVFRIYPQEVFCIVMAFSYLCVNSLPKGIDNLLIYLVQGCQLTRIKPIMACIVSTMSTVVTCTPAIINNHCIFYRTV